MPRTKVRGGHNDAELNNPRELSTERLGEIVDECLGRWDRYPTIPGSLRWRRNGSLALAEILRRCPE